MKITDRVKNAFVAFNGLETQKNSSSEASNFLRYGNRNKAMLQDWSQVEMSDKDMYTGYSYAAIKKRANRASALGKKFLYTEGTKAVQEAAKEKGEELEHPYLKLIKKSKLFTQRKFWHDISTYLDLEGVYYLMAVRAVSENKDGSPRIGEIQEFKMLNPYFVSRIIRESDGTVGAYLEQKNGLYREIPKEMIIEIRLLNPFDNDKAFSMTDAAKEAQFTMKQANDYTRSSIKGNINAPGAISTDVVLDDHVFDNFIARVQSHEKGEPLFGNGSGAINWTSMQVDLDKAALDKINEIHRSVLFAVSGTSKTTLGIEESGTTRDTSQVQKDNFTEDAVMPQVEDIIDALNLDYRKYYPEWDKNEYEIVLDNPLESDRESELKDIEIRQAELDLREDLVAKGYEYEIAARYAHGEISLEELGEPTMEEELSDQEVEAMAAKEVGLTMDEATGEDQEPESGDEVPADAKNRVIATNGFVPIGTNEKKLADAIKRAKALKKEQDKKTKEAEKSAKAEKKTPKVEEDKEDPKVSETGKKKDSESKPVDPVSNPSGSEAPKATIEVVLRSENQISARDYPEVYEDLDIDTSKLGCIMIDTEKIPVTQYVKDGANDLVQAEEDDHEMGAVSEVEPHVSLLFGLLENGNKWKDKVDKLLEGWKLDNVTIEEVTKFDTPDAWAIVAKVKKTPELIDGHERLTLLPHVNTFSEYQPHITLAYVKKDVDPEKWIKPLAKKYNGQIVATKGINYGDLPEEDSDNHVDDEHKTSGDAEPKKKDNNLVSNAHTCTESCLHSTNEFVPNYTLEKATNALSSDNRDTVQLQESSLYQATKQLEADMAQKVIAALRRGDIKTANDIISKSEEKSFVNFYTNILKTYFLVLFPIYGNQLMASRAARFGMMGIYAQTNDIERVINEQAKKGATSHVATVKNDFFKAVNEAVENSTRVKLTEFIMTGIAEQDQAILDFLPVNPNIEDVRKAIKKGTFDNEAIYKRAREAAQTGAGLDEIARAVRNTYEKISKTRAKTIARHETNRVFNMAQYQADVQFLTESGMMDSAYKVLYSRTGDPCPICNKLIEESEANPVPFQKNFADLGTKLTASYQKDNGKLATMTMPISYEAITAGNVHVNCNCEYKLVIKNEDGTFINNVDVRSNPDLEYVENKGGGNPNHDPATGEFTTGASIASSREALDQAKSSNKKIEKSTSSKTVGAEVAKVRKATDNYIKEHGGDPKKFHDIDENWVANDYGVLEKHVEKGDSKELTLVNKLQQAYFKENGITEVTVYRGVYGKQAKAIKASLAKGESVKISGDSASSWTGYDAVARDYSDGAAFTAPDKISDSVVIKQTFKVKDVVYSTQVAPYFAGNTNDEFVISKPKGFTVSPDDIEVVK